MDSNPVLNVTVVIWVSTESHEFYSLFSGVLSYCELNDKY